MTTTDPLPPTAPELTWSEDGATHTAAWRSEAGWAPPARVQPADDRMPADTAYRLVCEGTAMLWRGDFHNARQLLQALARRLERKPRKGAAEAPSTPAQAFHKHRQAQGRRARILAMVLVEMDGDYRIALRRAPDLRAACEEAWGPPQGRPQVVALRELQGLVGAHEWRKKGVEMPALGPDARIHPHYGVFSPVRGEYLDLLARAPLPADRSLAFDVGTGTGVVAALLARRGIARVVATDLNPRALACARDNLQRLQVHERVELLEADLFPPGRAPLVVCNPPWVPAKPGSALELAVYDPDSRMLRGFLSGLKDHLMPDGEGWLVLSDLAEHLGLRTREELLGLFAQAGLVVRAREDIRPRHPKAGDPDDPLAAARSREVTSLWRLAAA
jgi:methylase of polypeptide subunit release factors